MTRLAVLTSGARSSSCMSMRNTWQFWLQQQGAHVLSRACPALLSYIPVKDNCKQLVLAKFQMLLGTFKLAKLTQL
eukprot:g45615.t1